MINTSTIPHRCLFDRLDVKKRRRELIIGSASWSQTEWFSREFSAMQKWCVGFIAFCGYSPFVFFFFLVAIGPSKSCQLQTLWNVDAESFQFGLEYFYKFWFTSPFINGTWFQYWPTRRDRANPIDGTSTDYVNASQHSMYTFLKSHFDRDKSFSTISLLFSPPIAPSTLFTFYCVLTICSNSTSISWNNWLDI